MGNHKVVKKTTTGNKATWGWNLQNNTGNDRTKSPKKCYTRKSKPDFTAVLPENKTLTVEQFIKRVQIKDSYKEQKPFFKILPSLSCLLTADLPFFVNRLKARYIQLGFSPPSYSISMGCYLFADNKVPLGLCYINRSAWQRHGQEQKWAQFCTTWFVLMRVCGRLHL